MYDKIAVIEQNPIGGVVTLDPDGPGAELLFDLFVDLVGDGLDLSLVRTTGDDKKLSKARDAAQIQHDHIKRLFVGGTFDSELYFGV